MLPAVVLTSFVQNRSFTAIGIPGSFKSKFGLLSNSFESLRQFSKFSVTYAFSFFDFSDLSTKDFAASFDDIFLSYIFLINSKRLKDVISVITQLLSEQQKNHHFFQENF